MAWFPVVETFEFTLILSRGTDLDEDAAEALFAAGCDDGSPGMSAGAAMIDFHREASSLEKAISSAVDQVREAGFGVERAEVPVAATMAS